ncbi:hypothetical protein ACKI1O_46310, partial [Streptomyces scabiei]
AVDLERAAAELRATSLIQNEAVRRARMAEISAAALLDIAGSLRVLANEAAAAMLPDASADHLAGASVDYFAGEVAPDGPRDFLLEGDLVHKIDDDEPGVVVALGFDGDGELYADVEFGAGPVRLYASSLVRLVGDEARDPEILSTLAELRKAAAEGVPLVGVATEDETPALLTDSDEDGEEAVGGYELDEVIDDIDADFGDESHPAAESAVDVLRANEAARKAAKKKGSKK